MKNTLLVSEHYRSLEDCLKRNLDFGPGCIVDL